ncbi:MAG: LCP family protein [Anaerolineales bacterium]|nr:LCP family protein [Anaerolineales bacterium]
MESTQETNNIPKMERPEPKEEKKRSNRKVLLLILLFIAALIACILVSYFFLIPLGKSLWVTEATPIPVSPTEEQPTMIPEPEEIPSACIQTGTLSFLVLGVDAPYTDEPKGADAIRLVQLDFSTSEATVVALPRDIWVETPALAGLGIDSERLGLTYYHAKENVPEGEDEVIYATNMLAQTLYDNFGFIPDHYITVQIGQFDDIIDAIGGVVVEVPEEFSSIHYVYPAGQLRLDGEQTLEYASTLLVDTEWDRFNRQEAILEAVFDKVTNPAIIVSLPELISELADTITTDLSMLELTDLTCLADDLTEGAVNYVDVDRTMVTPQTDSAVLLPVEGAITDLLQDIFD